MNKVFYPSLALRNIWKNRRIYVPYILTCIFNIAMFYMMFYMGENPDLDTVPGNDILQVILVLGRIVMGIFSLLFLIYSNSFLVKRRKKEFGLYNVLGMEKRHIRRMIAWETLYVVILSFFFGLSFGILGSKLLFLFLLKLLHVPAQFGFLVSWRVLAGTGCWFLGIFLITMLMNMWQVQLANPIELLRGSSTGEKEPKAKWLIALIGIVCLGAGYYIAVTTQNPLEALLLFFVAVILVIIGTFCLFTAASIAILKVMRWKKSFYYQTRHFTSISGMLYRMKQNAAGLANICILSTGVLIMISGTVSMYAGMADIVKERYPYDVEIDIRGEQQEAAGDQILEKLQSVVEENGGKASRLGSNSSLTFSMEGDEEKLAFFDYDSIAIGSLDSSNMVTLSIMTLQDYNQFMGEDRKLEKDDEIFFYSVKDGKAFEHIWIQDRKFQVAGVLKECPYRGELSAYVGAGYFLVVRDRQVMEEIRDMETEAYQDAASEIHTNVMIDLVGDSKAKKELEELLETEIDQMMQQTAKGMGVYYSIDMKELEYQEMYSLYGGLFFLGLFLGILFLMGTTLIIYYKQVSEGYDDRERFEIMQNVGMSKKEVRQSVRSQILTVFFLPLVTACIHTAFAFPMVTRLLSTLNMYNSRLFLLCTVITAAIFALVYGIIYSVTARTYYKIVNTARGGQRF